jgi:uncharacterized protein (UPF0332 family)
MASWQSMSKIALQSAKFLQKAKGKPDLRGSVNRSYYAAYCAIAYALPAGLKYPRDRRNPPHEMIPELIRRHFGANALTANQQRELIKAFNQLKDARITADYRPRHTVDGNLADSCYRKAETILATLEVI